MPIIDLKIEEKVAYLTIKSPPANALSSKIITKLDELLTQIEKEDKAKVVVLQGEGKFFSAGADIKEFTSHQEAAEYESLAENGQRIFNKVEHFPIPVIASIHGAALGGGLELAMACHIRYATANAKIGLPEMNLGIIPGFAGTQRLPRYVGNARAYEMILTGEPISGKQAEAWGLINRVFEEDVFQNEVHNLARKIAAKSKPGINRIMKLIPYANTSQFEEGVKQEARLFGEIFGSADAKEGVSAFIEKRAANFQDK
ncbi:enoyl-CoA hydratase [Oceanobacillus sp. J11TS1]|uniref:enoyl-CoA hydratase n=1 Tax=Oceanobacillus sp. J11TS1 TaxID=2807191 RepID=UPI001B03FD54|nr:enoyl-CoA hydratase [Oceanobacillus sp. J11TS1]GIO21748.1 enoyl-CoA hydratase [Oceanobacillus sp. J11TS1]